MNREIYFTFYALYKQRHKCSDTVSVIYEDINDVSIKPGKANRMKMIHCREKRLERISKSCDII